MNKIGIYIVLVGFCLGCQRDDIPEREEIKLRSEPREIKPEIILAKEIEITEYIIGKSKYPLPEVRLADHSNVVPYTGPKTINLGITSSINGPAIAPEYTPLTDSIVYDLGEGEFKIPYSIDMGNPVSILIDSVDSYKQYIVANNWYSVQHGDTLLPPMRIIAPQPQSISIDQPRYKDNAIIDNKYLDIEDFGMFITSVLEDSDGNIWLAENGTGLARYDGNSLLKFRYENGMIGRLITDTKIDDKGNIWIATLNFGLGMYDGISFTWYGKAQGLTTDVPMNILHTKGGVWITNQQGLIRIEENEMNIYPIDWGDYLMDSRGVKLMEDRNGAIWIGSKQLIKFDNNQFIKYPQLVKSGFVTDIAESRDDEIWIATSQNGIYQFNCSGFTNYSTLQGFPSSVKTLLVDSKNHIWFGTFGQGIYGFEGAKLINYTTSHGLTNNFINSIYEDSAGNIWIGSNAGQLSIFNPFGFQHITSDQGLKLGAHKLLEDEDGNIWFCTFGEGIGKFDGNNFTYYTQNEGLAGDFANDIEFDEEGNLWIVCKFNGISKFDGTYFTNYKISNDDELNFPSSIEIDKNNVKWVGLYYTGLLKLDDQHESKFVHYKHSFFDKVVTSLKFTDSDEFFIGSYGNGLASFVNGQLQIYNEANGFIGNFVSSIINANNGDRLVTTTSGLTRYNGKFAIINSDDLLESRSVIEDQENNLWLAKESGISIIAKERKQVINYKTLDGLKFGFFSFDAVLIVGNEKLWWSSVNAITTIDRKNYTLPSSIPKLHFTQIKINEKTTDFNFQSKSDLDDQGIEFSGNKKFYNYPKDLILAYHKNSIQIEFAAIDWTSPHQIEYQTKLDRFDKEWKDPTFANSVKFENLLHGSYSLKVRAKGITNLWSEPIEYSFTILPPWWHTWWARTIYGLLFILMMSGIIRMRTRILLRQKVQLEDEVEMRTHELKNAQAQLIQSEKMASLGQLTAGIAHEINNPVSFTQISSFALDQDLKEIEHLIEKYRAYIQNRKEDPSEIEDFEKSIDFKFLLKAINQSINDIKEGTKRTSEIVKGLREFSHIDQEEMALADIHHGIDITLNLLKSKFGDKIVLTKNYDQSIGGINCHIGQLNQVFMNLLINAIDAIEEIGEIVITTKDQGNSILISIEDNGHGIKEEIFAKIFDPFFTTKKIGEGMGLGLSISHGIIKNHGGTITVSSDSENGTRFDIVLPKG